MRKVWLYQRRNRPGVYVMWYGNDGRQRSKRLPNLQVAKVWRTRLEQQLNDDMYVEAVMLPWQELCQQFLADRQDVRGATPGTLKNYLCLLNTFARTCGKPHSTRINHAVMAQYVAARRKAGTAPGTVNKDLQNLHALITWGIRQHYMGKPAQDIEWHHLRQKVAKSEIASLGIHEFAHLLATAERLYGVHWRIRLLLAIGTGLRVQDVERLRIEDIDWDRQTIETVNTKAQKRMRNRPLHPTILEQVQPYVGNRRTGRILQDQHSYHKWDRIRTVAGMPNVKFHQLRKSFASFLADAGFSPAVVQELLEHSSAELTKRIYMSGARQHRSAAQAIPIDEILRAAKGQPPQETDAASPKRPPDDSGSPGSP